MKIELDKYYTPITLANYCWRLVDKYIGLNNISEIIEPSVGNGSFCKFPKCKPDLCIDIKPQYDKAIKSNYLTYKLNYKKGRLIIGNPPYGDRLKLARDFYNKSCEIADYIAFILPISQLNNTTSFYKFDLIYSEDLDEDYYSDRKLHCCFNIYKRPENGELNSFVKQSFNGITFYRQDRNNYNNIVDYDIRMCYWGSGTCGKILTNTDEHYSGEYKIKINDKHPQKKQIIKLFNTINWNSLVKGIAMKRLKQYIIFEELKKHGIKEM